MLSGLSKSSHVVSKAEWMAVVRHGRSACRLLGFKILPWGVRLMACGWYLCMSLVRSWVKLVTGECFVCYEKSYSYLTGDKSMGEDGAPDRWEMYSFLLVFFLF